MKNSVNLFTNTIYYRTKQDNYLSFFCNIWYNLYQGIIKSIDSRDKNKFLNIIHNVDNKKLNKYSKTAIKSFLCKILIK